MRVAASADAGGRQRRRRRTQGRATAPRDAFDGGGAGRCRRMTAATPRDAGGRQWRRRTEVRAAAPADDIDGRRQQLWQRGRHIPTDAVPRPWAVRRAGRLISHPFVLSLPPSLLHVTEKSDVGHPIVVYCTRIEGIQNIL